MQTELELKNSSPETPCDLIDIVTAERIATWLAIAVAVFAIAELALS